MLRQTKTCQNCKSEFVIEPEDFAFYEKIKVPAPTWCPGCRLIRRMSWRNMWHLYKKPDGKTGQPIFSAFPPESPVKIYEKDYWLSDAWNPMDYGKDIDWSRPFLKQVHELMLTVPLPNHSVQNIVNSEYCTNASFIKNCYFTRAVTHTEDCAYVIWDDRSKNCMDSHMTDSCELGYGNVNTTRCYKAIFSVNCEDCQNVFLSRDCVNCSNCIGCTGLRSKSYHIFNTPYTKEEYENKFKEFNLGSKKSFENCRSQAYAQWLKAPVKFMEGLQNSNVYGDYIYNSKNAKHCYRVKEIEDSKYCMNILAGPNKDLYDYANWGAGSELIYESLVCADKSYNVKFSWNCFPSSRNVEYSIFCRSSSDIFGCVSLRKGQYCILNKQYSKEEYEELVPKIIKNMDSVPYVDKVGRVYNYGEFFPAEFSPIQYNDSEAHEIFPKTKEQVLDEGLMWREDKLKAYTATKQPDDLPDNIAEAGDFILKETIACEHRGQCREECTEAFRIIPTELEFLEKLNLPLPRLCPNCRHYERLSHRNTFRFWQRQCQCAGTQSENGAYTNQTIHFHQQDHCPNEFETSYSPERKEIVYCEQCYQQEVV